MKACYQCGAEAEFVCDVCEEPICYDCCTPMTIHNQIDYPLCGQCNDNREAEAAEHYHKIEEAKEAARLKLEAKYAKARAVYWKPVNVEKRRLAKIQRKRERAEAARERLAEAFRIVNDWLR